MHCVSGAKFCLAQHRQEHGGQDSDYRDDRKQFDQGKRARADLEGRSWKHDALNVSAAIAEQGTKLFAIHLACALPSAKPDVTVLREPRSKCSSFVQSTGMLLVRFRPALFAED